MYLKAEKMKMKVIALSVIAALLSLALTRKPITWVAIGDSITYLNEHRNEAGNRIKKGYMTGVVERLPHIRYINQGHNGWTSGGIAEQIEKPGIAKADIYSVFLGTNDWWQGRPLGELSDYKNNSGNNTVYGSFRIIVNKLRSLNPDAKIIFITPMQRTDFVYLFDMKNNAYGSYEEKNGQSLEQFAEAIKAIAKQESFEVVDLYNNRKLQIKNLVKFKRLKDPNTGEYKNYKYPEYRSIPFNPQADEYPYPKAAIKMTYDGLHPSDKGYAILIDILVKIIKGY